MNFQLNRRDLLSLLPAALIGGAARTGHAHGFARYAAAGPQSKSSGIQLGAQTNAWPIDPKRFDTLLTALHEIRQTGYSGFETGFANLRSQAKSLAEARRRIEETQLTFIGVHIFLPEYDWQTNIASPELYEPVAQSGAALGAQRLILSGAPAVTDEEIKRKADALNVAGAFAQTLGLKLAYHNHWPEFKWKRKEIEALYAATDPARVSFLLDAGHAYRTGIDLPEFLERHSQRIAGIHFRDYRDGAQVPLGQGTLPLAKIAATLKAANWSGWAMDEEEREDGSKQGLAVIQPAFQALKGAFTA